MKTSDLCGSTPKWIHVTNMSGHLPSHPHLVAPSSPGMDVLEIRHTHTGRHTLVFFACHAASTVHHATAPPSRTMIPSPYHYIFLTGKNGGAVEKANSLLPLAQSSCFRGGFKACHKTSCIVNSAASMADWWAICLVDCLAPGPWSHVYVWALLFHMYRPPDHFLPPPPPLPVFSLAELMAYTSRHKHAHKQAHTGQCAQRSHTCIRTDT